MNLKSPNADIFIPDKSSLQVALGRTTHLAFGAHADDLEIMAFHGISTCYKSSDQWFTGIVLCDGAGSPRAGKYSRYSDLEMMNIRKKEQKEAALRGEYSAVIQLGYSSQDIKSHGFQNAVDDILSILTMTTPEIVYLHNPADAHDTHVAVFLRCLEALRFLSPGQRPKQILACEVWRDLDWLSSKDKVALDVSKYPDLAQELCAVFDSQVSGGKRYDLATVARRRAHATFSESHHVDAADGLTYAIDVSGLVENTKLSTLNFVDSIIENFRNEVRDKILKYQNPKT
jgi:LmbE family N-acetylglucosaminyl deacetylase